MDQAVLKKDDKIRVVTTERIVPEPAVVLPKKVPPLIALPQDAEGENGRLPKYHKRERVRHASIETNICTRHGKRKVVTRGGKSWRCR